MNGDQGGGVPRFNRRSLIGLLGGGLGYPAVTHLLGPETARAAAPSGTLLVGMELLMKSIDPGRTIEASAYMINHAIYDSLVTFDGEDLKTPKPQLATGWKASPDGKTYTFTLRPNVRFSSGNPMTSADVKWSLHRVINLKANTKFLIEGIEEVLAPDPLTVVVRLSESKPSIIPILSSPSLCVVDSKVVMENGGEAGPDAKDKDRAEPYLSAHSAGTGAYTLGSYIPNQELTLVKNPAHWRGAPKFDRIVIRHIPEPATQQLQIARGDLDVATGIGPDQAQVLRTAPGVTVKTSLIANTFYVLMNNNPQIGGPFANPRVQQAVRYALDYAGIMAIAGAGAQRLASIIPNSFPGSLDPRTAVTTDREKARALLREAGVGVVRGRITYPAGATSWGVQVDLLVQKIQTDLNAVGMTIDLNGLASLTALQEYRDGKNQIGVWGWTADWPDPSNFLVYLPGRTVGKRAGWPADAGPEAAALAKLGDQAEREVDTPKRVALYERVARRIAEIGPYAPLFQPAVPYAMRSNVRGATYNSVWEVDLYALGKSG
ncbi:MAG: ABC transporter substrate-binding protein [Bacillati bacterium ANGP1]|uniref:ABC transporter substrate-binding protein n=1 Tax=Candidatus Segetimicrobium genomatis TaxID=2569760 RepID=A0A537JCV6_9BACT|nr:MAG: ABC transporter substrate-binding protein [Terrabacteria group bacterium ANGP1]